MSKWLNGLLGGALGNTPTAPQNALQQTAAPNFNSQQLSLGLSQMRASTSSSYAGITWQYTHDQLLENHLRTLLAERKFTVWVREKLRRDINAKAPGYFDPVAQCTCAWCQLSELERQVALAAASEAK